MDISKEIDAILENAKGDIINLLADFRDAISELHAEKEELKEKLEEAAEVEQAELKELNRQLNHCHLNH